MSTEVLHYSLLSEGAVSHAKQMRYVLTDTKPRQASLRHKDGLQVAESNIDSDNHAQIMKRDWDNHCSRHTWKVKIINKPTYDPLTKWTQPTKGKTYENSHPRKHVHSRLCGC